jgi:hypothetical protein
MLKNRIVILHEQLASKFLANFLQFLNKKENYGRQLQNFTRNLLSSKQHLGTYSNDFTTSV